MKSLNTKKIVALAAGAALLGGALLGAGSVTFGNTELVNANGQPLAKVVVGGAAKASDGVAAANIAAVLGNHAFKQSEVTATPTGLDGLSCEVSGEAGTCEVLSKSVTLELESPAGAIPAGAYAFDMLIDDYIDEDTMDRATDTITATPDPFNSGTSSATITAIKVTGSDFTPLGDYVPKDTQAGAEYEEEQYLYAKSDGVAFNNDDGDFRSSNTKVAYEIVFGTDGIPVCQDSVGGDWGYCVNSSHDDYNTDKATENHRVKVKYLGEEWIISDMEQPNGGSGSSAYEGGKIKLAKESAYSPKLQIGESLDLGDGNTLMLGDLKPASGQQTNDLAIFSVKNSAGEEIANKVVSAGATTEIQAGDNTYRVRVYQVAPGYTLTEKWAEVAVFSNELTLESGKKIDDEANKKWKVKLVWKDLDDSSPKADRLHKIQLFSTENKNLNTGDSVDVIPDPTRWKFTFSGLDLQDSDYVDVQFALEGASSYRFNHNSTSSSHDGTEDYEAGTSSSTNDKVIVVSAGEKIFKFQDANNEEITTDEFVYCPTVYNYTATDDASWTGNQAVLVEVGGDYVPVQNANTGSRSQAATDPWELNYNFGGAEYPMWFEIGEWNSTNNDLNGSGTLSAADSNFIVLINIGEDAGNNDADWLSIRAVEKTDESAGTAPSGGAWDLEFDFSGETDGSEEDYVIYRADLSNDISSSVRTNFANSSTQIDETKYYTHRGSYVDTGDTGTTSYTAYLAKDVGNLRFMFESVSEGTTEGTVTTYSDLAEGDSIDLSDGSTLTVKSIDVETGGASCESATVTGLEGVSCALNVADTANLGERQDVPTDLVVLDSEAASAETVIAVGGPAVNTVTEAILSGTDVALEAPGDVVVQEIETGKIVVAGYSAEDTMTAAQQFISQLTG